MKDEAQQFSLQGEGISVGYQQNIIIPKMDKSLPSLAPMAAANPRC